MNPKFIILAGSDLQFLNLLSERINKAFPEKEVYTTNEAFDVCHQVQTKMPAVIVLEMIFPQWDWNGYTLFKFFKKDARIKGMKSVLIMDTLNEKAQSIAKDKDINKVLFKIYNMDFIFEEIKKLI